MIQFVCYFFPSILAVWITEKIGKNNFKLKDFIYHFVLYTIIINFSIFAIIHIVFHPTIEYLSTIEFTYSFTIKYLCIALSLSIAYPLIQNILIHNLEFSISVEEPAKRGRKPKVKKEELPNERTKKTNKKK